MTSPTKFQHWLRQSILDYLNQNGPSRGSVVAAAVGCNERQYWSAKRTMVAHGEVSTPSFGVVEALVAVTKTPEQLVSERNKAARAAQAANAGKDRARKQKSPAAKACTGIIRNTDPMRPCTPCPDAMHSRGIKVGGIASIERAGG